MSLWYKFTIFRSFRWYHKTIGQISVCLIPCQIGREWLCASMKTNQELYVYVNAPLDVMIIAGLLPLCPFSSLPAALRRPENGLTKSISYLKVSFCVFAFKPIVCAAFWKNTLCVSDLLSRPFSSFKCCCLIKNSGQRTLGVRTNVFLVFKKNGPELAFYNTDEL